MRIKVIYRKNLKMSEGKLAAQVSHAVKNLGPTPADCSIIVLKVSDKKFNELTSKTNCYIQVDRGLTELPPNTPTTAAWIEHEPTEIGVGKKPFKFRYWLKLNIDNWGDYNKGDETLFYMNLNDEGNGLARFPIDKHWDIIRCDQYTGLKDSEGEEIYEGDILLSELYGVGVVIWNNEQSHYCVTIVGNETEHCFVLGFGKIIGNIHENPTRLKTYNT
jgi:hypothetical protein